MALACVEQIRVLGADSSASQVVRDVCLSGEQEDAFYVLDIGDLVRKHAAWMRCMPRVKPFYAVKCNDDPTVIKVLAALGTGFDCASMGEMDKVLNAGVEPSRIILANPTKPLSHIRHAASLKVNLATFDNETELLKVKSLHPNTRLLVRVRCDAKISLLQFGDKFGCDAVLDAPRLLRLARHLGLRVAGVSFHVGTGCEEPAVFRRAIALARQLFDAAETLGFHMDLLDIGGGFPGNKGTSIDKIGCVVNAALEEFFPSAAVSVMAEPGRYYVASAFTLATCIHSKREVHSDPRRVMYYINDGYYGSFSGLLLEGSTVVPSLLHAPAGELIPSSIWGPTGDGLDKVNDHVLLPPLDIGDWLIYENMGAYTLVIASTFNGFPLPKVIAVIDQTTLKLLPLSVNHLVSSSTVASLHTDLPDSFCRG